MKSKLKSTISNFLNELLEGESPGETNVTPNKRGEDIRLAEITKITKYHRNCFGLTDDGRFLSMTCWDSRATYNNLLYPIIQLTLDKCDNENVYLPETFTTFFNNLDFSKVSDPSEFVTISEKLRKLYEIRDLLKNTGKNKSDKYKKFRDVKLKQIFSLFTELGRLLKSYNDLPYAQNGVQVSMDIRNDLKSYLRNLEEWNNERKEISEKRLKHPYLKFNLRERPHLPRYKPKQSEYRVVYPKQLFQYSNVQDKIEVREIKYKNYSKKLIDIPIPISRSNEKYKKLGRKFLVRKVTFRFDMFKDLDDFWSRFRQIRIIPKGTYYNIELVYIPKRKKADVDPSRVLAIDFNQCNLLTFTDNIGNRPRIIGGGVIKKANFLLHHQCSELQSNYTIPKSLINTHLRTKDPILDLITNRKIRLEQYIENRKKKKGEKYNPHLIKLYEKQDDLQKEINMYQKQKDRAERKLRTVSTQTEKNELEFEISILLHDLGEKTRYLKNINKNIKNIIREYRIKLNIYDNLEKKLSILPSEKKRIERLETIRDEHKIEYFRVVNYRNSAVKDWTHKIARYIINHCKDNRIGVIICGYNKGWKNNAPLKRFNKIFQLLPHLRIVEYLEYIGLLEGIDVIRTEEGYTSMASHLNLADMDLLKKLGDEIKLLKYKIEKTDDPRLIAQYDDKVQKLRKLMNKEKKGIRGVYINPKSNRLPNAEPYISRGLFKSYAYGIIHSDVNADLGIGRKADEIICQKYGLSTKPFESYIKKIRSNGLYRKILNPIRIKNIEVALSSI